MELIRRLRSRITAVSNWAVWSLPRRLTVFVLAVVTAYVIAIGIAARFTTFTEHDLVLFGVLLACTAIAVELSRRAKERSGWDKDVQGVWEFPIVILLPPLFALLAPISRLALTQWRVSRPPAPAGFQLLVDRPVVLRRVACVPRVVRSPDRRERRGTALRTGMDRARDVQRGADGRRE